MGPAVQRKKNPGHVITAVKTAFVILYLNAIQNLDCLASGCVRTCVCASPCGVGVF